MSAIGGILATDRTRADTAVVALAVIGLVWIGALLGVSFLATPVKFLAPSLSLPVALDVGRQTFRWLNRVEIVLACAAAISAVAYELPRLRALLVRGGQLPLATILTVSLVAVVAFQSLWLLPQLDARVEIILQGGMPPPSNLHDVYVALEAGKLGVLVGVAWLSIAALRGGSRERHG